MESLAKVIWERSEGNRDVAMLLIKICKELPPEEVSNFFDRLEIYEISAIQLWIRYQQCDKDMYELVTSLKE
jgi:hypothetical protein